MSLLFFHNVFQENKFFNNNQPHSTKLSIDDEKNLIVREIKQLANQNVQKVH